MKRDWDLIREILISLESDRQFDEGNSDKIAHHVDMMAEGGLIKESEFDHLLLELTNKGHDFVAMFRDDKKWQAMKKRMEDNGFKDGFPSFMIRGEHFAL